MLVGFLYKVVFIDPVMDDGHSLLETPNSFLESPNAF